MKQPLIVWIGLFFIVFPFCLSLWGFKGAVLGVLIAFLLQLLYGILSERKMRGEK